MSVFHRPATPWSGRDDPEDGVNALRLHHLETAASDLKILGFACEAGVARNKGRIGAKAAPAAIRKAMAGLSAPMTAKAFTDLGDVVVEDDALEEGQMLLADHIKEAISAGGHLVVLGGGHETAFGSFMGLHKAFPDKRIGVINLDAHLDLRWQRQRGEVGPQRQPEGKAQYQGPDVQPQSLLDAKLEADALRRVVADRTLRVLSGQRFHSGQSKEKRGRPFSVQCARHGLQRVPGRPLHMVDCTRRVPEGVFDA